MFVACSTLCFASQSLEATLRRILELEFNRVELALHEDGTELRPSAITADLDAVLELLHRGPSLSISALDVRFGQVDDITQQKQFSAICRLAKTLMVAVLAIPASPLETPIGVELTRLKRLNDLASTEGLVLTLTTESDTLTADPATAAALCESVPGLALTLDPSHYINGPLQSDAFDDVFPFVQNVHFRDSGRKPGQFQVQVGQGEVEYGKVVGQLERFNYQRALTVAILDRPDNPFDLELEVRKLKLLLESLL